MTRPTKIFLSQKNLSHNLSIVKKHCPNQKIIGVIKANAYGHGAVKMAKALSTCGVDALAVCATEEALELLDAKITTPIILLEGFFCQQELPKIISLGLIPVIHNTTQVKILTKHKIAGPLNVIIKVDTGMHRLGFSLKAFAKVCAELENINQVNIFFVMSHFAKADEPQNAKNNLQLEAFNLVTNQLEAPKSMANSAAILGLANSYFDWVRPGIMLYGSNPLLSGKNSDFDLRPVMRFESEIISIKKIKAKETVGYGGTWQATDDSTIGVVAAGYGDGYPRHSPNGTPVAVNGQIVPLVGRVSMDMLSVDLSVLENVKVGDKVELWGDIVSVDEVAEKSATISYELFCSITKRVQRIYE